MFFHVEKKNGVFAQNLLFLSAGIFSNTCFSSRILRFLESSFLTLLIVGKGQGLFFISEKVQSAFLTFEKSAGQGALQKK